MQIIVSDVTGDCEASKTESSLRLLRDLGCDVAQGLFCRPAAEAQPTDPVLDEFEERWHMLIGDEPQLPFRVPRRLYGLAPAIPSGSSRLMDTSCANRTSAIPRNKGGDHEQQACSIGIGQPHEFGGKQHSKQQSRTNAGDQGREDAGLQQCRTAQQTFEISFQVRAGLVVLWNRIEGPHALHPSATFLKVISEAKAATAQGESRDVADEKMVARRLASE